MPYAYKMSRSSSVTKRFARNATGGRKTTATKRRRGQYIDPSKFVKTAVPQEVDAYEPQHTFADFALAPLLKRNLAAKGYITPSPIQDQSIPVGLRGQDVIGIASTGTGKTAAFALPVLDRLLQDQDAAAIIIAPTRELAQQIEEECKSLARGSGLFGALLIGGSSMGNQLRDLSSKPRIVIGTPGRIKDHLKQGTLKLQRFNMVVLDEVDRMLDMGFVNDVTEILSHTAEKRQCFFYSATIDSRVRTLIDKFTTEPITISLKASTSSENVHQDIVRYQTSGDKIEKLHDLLNNQDLKKVIVFEETQRSVERLSKELLGRGFKADAIHGGKTQGQRNRALQSFKKDTIHILVATDVAARGIDVSGVTHVINYSVPQTYDDYIHRIGRAGRAGKIGFALTFINE